MQTRRDSENRLRRACGLMCRGMGRSIGYMITLLAACLVSMFASFLLVRYLTPLAGPAVGANEKVVAAAIRWQNTCSELAQLTAEFIDESKKTPDPSSETYRLALSERLLPRVNDLRRRLSSLADSGETDIMLLKVADQLAQALVQPQNEGLRLQVTEDALVAVEEVETRIRVLGIREQVGPVVDVRALRRGP